MSIQVIMPQLGEGVVEATVVKWLKAKGDIVKEFEPLLEVETDKVIAEVPSPADGILQDLLAEEGATVKMGMLLTQIEGTVEPAIATETGARPPGNGQSSQTESLSKLLASGGSPTLGSTEIVARAGAHEKGFISPLVAKLAAENQVDLEKVPGTGLSGRITKQDVLDFIESREKAAMHVQEKQQEIPPIASSVASADTVLPLTSLRRVIAERMVSSERTSPHVTTVMEADLSRVAAHLKANKEIFGRDGVSLTYSAYFCMATVAALKAYPLVNSSWSEAGIVLHRAINLGLATSLGEAGLIVPVIKGADGLSLLGLARLINDLSGRARARQLQLEEVKGGTFTITNHGVSGSLLAIPIINQPECAILGVGAIQKRVVVVSAPDGSEAIAIRPMVYLGLTFDHRILDGAMADNFLSKVVTYLQEWERGKD